MDFNNIIVNDDKDDIVKDKKENINNIKDKKGKEKKKKEEIIEDNEDNELIGITIKREENFPEW